MSNALDLLSNNTVVLIICGSELTDASGHQFLRVLKSSPLLKKIPFVFFVPSHFVTLEVEVSTVLEAFDMGAADFIVYTPGEEVSKVLIKRMSKMLPPLAENERISASPKAVHQESFASQADVASPMPQERRDNERIIQKQIVNIEISRDTVLWMPGRIININKDGLLMETSLLGKLGMLLYLRVSLPEGTYVIKSHIRHISISGHQFSAEIGVKVETSKEWIETYHYITTRKDTITKPDAVDKMPGEKTNDAITTARIEEKKQQVDKALEIKFYHSLIGKQLGNYKAVSFIGAGSMGGVFKGWDVVLERNVAMKVISYNLSTIESFRDMFVKEARLVSRLTHPNIAQIYHIDQMSDVLYFAMEFISGGTLADLIKNRNKLNTAKVLEHFITICRTLDFVSRQNIVHRDIKPANIMINDQGILKVVDFGVAIVNDETNKKRTPEGFGSPLYVSPECIKGGQQDCRSDMYSLAATFYHIFTGVPPFEGDSVEAIFFKHLNEDLVPLKIKNPNLSRELSDIIGKMMAKTPGQRYQNYQAIIDDLTVLMQGD
ncbi:MAG: protein kinase [Smithella sp.]